MGKYLNATTNALEPVAIPPAFPPSALCDFMEEKETETSHHDHVKARALFVGDLKGSV